MHSFELVLRLLIIQNDNLKDLLEQKVREVIKLISVWDRPYPV